MRKILFGMALLIAFTLSVAVARGEIPEAALKKIKAALPDKAVVKPARPRRLLIFTLCRGYRHASIPYAAKALELMGKKTGAYNAVVSDDLAMFEPENLKQFDAVCMDHTTGEVFTAPNLDKLPPDQKKKALEREARLKKSLLDYVASGKGIVGIHAATDCFYKWPAYGDMMGAYFDGHPWHENVTIKVDDPTNPLCAPFKGKDFQIVDEIYQFRAPYSRDKLRVLLSLNTLKTNMHKKGIHRNDNDFAVSWVRSYGKGRVFYCSLGHRPEIFWNPLILKYYLGGIQFALGDLPVDTTPSAKITKNGWRVLFNGKDLTGWIARPGSWTVKEGVLTRVGGGYIWTAEQFGDFILDLDFMISKGGNSGIFFRTANIRDCVQTGIEMQVLDSYGKKTPGRHDCGAIYDCLAPSKNVVKKPGEWNHVTITCKGSKIQIVMNGEQIIDMDLNKWTEPHKNPDGTPNKFRTAYKDMPRKGHIGFQDHGDPVWYRNIRIKVLD